MIGLMMYYEEGFMIWTQSEEWRPVPGFEGAYEVSSVGRVRSLRFSPPKVIWQGLKSDGYPYVRLWFDRKLSTFKVHRLVCRAFHGEQPNPLHNQVGHLDGDRTNARAENLKWVGKIENHSHQRAHGTSPVGEKHPRALLTERDVSEIRMRRSERAKSLAEEYKVSRHTIYDVWQGVRWRHVPAIGFNQA